MVQANQKAGYRPRDQNEPIRRPDVYGMVFGFLYDIMAGRQVRNKTFNGFNHG